MFVDILVANWEYCFGCATDKALAQDQFKEKEIEELVVDSTGQNSDTEILDADATSKLISHDNLLSPGTVISGHYEILSVIGQGAMGTVYKTRHLLVDKIRAVKILRVVSDSQILRRFQQEAKASLTLDHPNIVRVYEFGIESQLQQPYLVMEYVEGEALSTILANGEKLSQEHACAVIKQVCEGLAHSHSHGIVHRDVKPANIILTKDGDGAELAKLVDFGIAKFTTPENGQNLTQTGEVFGTPLYMSPEQCLGRKVDARSDIYSLGCVLYECLVGQPPFKGESSLETIMMHVNPPELDFSAASAHKYVKNIILKALNTSVDERYQSAQELGQDLLRVLRGEPIRLPRSKPLTSLRFPRHRQPIVVTAVASILFVIAVIFGTIFVQLNERMLAKQSPADSAWNLHVLAERQIRDGQLTQAKRNEELALVLLEQAKPDEVQKTRTNICLRSLAALEESQGDTVSAEHRLKDALDFAQQAPGPANSLLLDTRRQIADFYRKHNRIQDAKKFDTQTSNQISE